MYHSILNREKLKVLKPLGKNIVAIQRKAENKTASGLYLTDQQKTPKVAVISAIGSEVKEVRVADEVLFKQYEVTEVVINDTKYLVFNEDAVLAVVEKTND